jgi:hypothetical protein
MKKLYIFAFAALISLALLTAWRVDDVPYPSPTVTATAPWVKPADPKQDRKHTTARSPQSGHDKTWITPAGPTATLYTYP